MFSKTNGASSWPRNPIINATEERAKYETCHAKEPNPETGLALIDPSLAIRRRNKMDSSAQTYAIEKSGGDNSTYDKEDLLSRSRNDG